MRDVNFEIRQGAAVGIIGRNGAGKNVVENSEPDYRTFGGPGDDPGTGGESAGSGHGVSSGIDRAGEYCFEWRDPGYDPPGD